MRIALGLEYDGSAFCGWQTQPSGRAVQNALETALKRRDVAAFIVEPIQAEGGIVVEGRDIGSVVFPETPFKIYVDADEHVRQSRRRDAGEFALENLQAYAEGRPLQAAITPGVYDTST